MQLLFLFCTRARQRVCASPIVSVVAPSLSTRSPALIFCWRAPTTLFSLFLFKSPSLLRGRRSSRERARRIALAEAHNGTEAAREICIRATACRTAAPLVTTLGQAPWGTPANPSAPVPDPHPGRRDPIRGLRGRRPDRRDPIRGLRGRLLPIRRGPCRRDPGCRVHGHRVRGSPGVRGNPGVRGCRRRWWCPRSPSLSTPRSRRSRSP